MSSVKTVEKLPDNIVLFDGECVLCSDFFRFLVKYDKKKIYSFATLQSSVGKQILAQAYSGKQIPDSVVLFQNGKVYDKSGAALRIVYGLGGAFYFLRIFSFIPVRILDWAYDRIAKLRYKWWGKQNCLIPDDNIRSRFIDDKFDDMQANNT